MFATSRCIEVDEGIEMSLLEERRWVEVVEVVELVLVDDLLLLVGILTLNKLTQDAVLSLPCRLRKRFIFRKSCGIWW